jgi:hypothetical protein
LTIMNITIGIDLQRELAEIEAKIKAKSLAR